MLAGEITITKPELEKLSVMLHHVLVSKGRDTAHFENLQYDLKRATLVEPTVVARNVVTMNSTVRLKNLTTDENLVYTLVYPEQADIAQGKISILAPIGMAIFGYKAGDVVEWMVSEDIARYRIEEILYQPEAAGDFRP
jgi:regulator of nucleoside diphosphate kinase